MSRLQSLFTIILATVILGLASGILLAYQSEAPPESSGSLERTAVTAASPPSDVASIAALGGWPHPRHDSGQTGYTAGVGSFRPPLVLFDAVDLDESTAGSEPIFSLVTGPSRIFAFGLISIWGIDKEDSTIQWINEDCLFDPVTSEYCFPSYMAYSSDGLVILRQKLFPLNIPPDPVVDWELVVLHPDTGLEDWSLSLGENAPEITVDGNSILLLTEDPDGKLIKLSSDGNTQYFEKDADVEGAPSGHAVAGAGLFLYPRGDSFPKGDRILAYDTTSGQPAWVFTDTARIDSRPYDLVATSDAIIVSQGERVFKLDPSDGSLLWETDVYPGDCQNPSSPNVAASDGTIIAITAVCDDEVVVLDYDNLSEKWRKSIGLQTATAVAIGGDVLYIASIESSVPYLWALDPGSGAELEAKRELGPGESTSVVVVSDGLLLTVSNIGTGLLQRFERTPADLAVSLSPVALPVCGAAVGGTVTYNFLVTNNGPGTTDNTRADLTLPDGFATLSTSKGSCTGGTSPFCDLGPLSNGQQVQIAATIVLSTAGSYMPGLTLSGDVRDQDDSNDNAGQPLTVDPAPPAGNDLMLTDIEITQGIQNMTNTVPLVNGKPTFVRVYGQTNGGTVKGVSALLHGQRYFGGEDLGTLSPINGSACLELDGDTPDRDQFSDSFVFELPESWWSGGVTMTAELNAGENIPDAVPQNDSQSRLASFTRLPRVCLKTYPVRTTGRPTATSPETDNLSPDAWSIADDVGDILSRAFTMLPVREIRVYASSHLIEEWEPFAAGGWGPYEMMKSDDNRGDVLDTLWWLNLFSDDPDLCDADDSLTHYVGMVHPGTTNDVGSAGLGIRDGDELMIFLVTGPNGPQAFDDPHGGLTLAHEIGHNYDRLHVNCREPKDPDKNYPKDRNPCNFAPINPRGYYGLEFRNPTVPTVITPTMAGDLMSYARDVWPSEYTWQAIQDKLCDANDCNFPTLVASKAPELSASAAVSLTGDVLILRGWISPTVAIQGAYRLPVEQVPKADALWAEQVATRPLTATYALNLFNGPTLLHSEPFSPTYSADQESARTTFGLVLPWNPAATRVELTEAGTTVISLTLSASPPTVTAVLPNGGETITDTLLVSWTAEDLDEDPLKFSVLYSPDNGASWLALATGVETTTLTIDSSLLPGTAGQGLVKVIATDGLNYGSRQSAAPFTIPNRLPHAAIYFPDDGGEYASGSSLTLRGAVYDPEDGYLPTGVMSWTLSGAPVGYGNNIPLAGLEDGVYTLTLSAGDDDAQIGETTISFMIGGVITPSIEVQKVAIGQDANVPTSTYVIVGDLVTWTVTISNNGNIDLGNVLVMDDNGTPDDLGDDFELCSFTQLAQLEEQTCAAYSNPAKAGLHVNKALVTAWYQSQQFTFTAQSTYFGIAPTITFNKYTNGFDADAAPGPSLILGGPVTWTYVLTNSGNITLTNVSIIDHQVVPLSCPDLVTLELGPGDTVICSATGVAILGKYVNEATASARPPIGPVISLSDFSHYQGRALVYLPIILRR